MLSPDGLLRFRVAVHNTGEREGAEVVQVYTGPAEPDPGLPPKQLAAFRKVRVRPGRKKTAVFELSARDFEQWDAGTRQWGVPGGRYCVHIGTSANRIAASFVFTFPPDGG